ncbi:MAG: prephenate dehydratase [Ignavibacteriales bacterium]|nr:MAG: prephenate dehydratase [Ignavibacteriales bacterium]
MKAKGFNIFNYTKITIGEKLKVIAYQGETGAYSELAAKKFFGEKIKLSPSLTFESVFNKVENDEAQYGVVPVENSLYGSVFETLDLLKKYSFGIIGELNLQINHYLMSTKKYRLSQIKKIYSHPQALGQCSEFIKSIKNVNVNPVYDTAGAAKIISEKNEEFAAAVASKNAAKEYSLQIIKGHIQNNEENFTRFLIISKNDRRIGKDDTNYKTSVCFELKSIPGALFKALSVFALRDINLTKIESRPIPHKTFEYLFYVDLIGNVKDNKIKLALNHLEEISKVVKVLGSYPIGKTYKD